MNRTTIRLTLSMGFNSNNNSSNRGRIEQIIKVRKGLHPLKIKFLISCQIIKNKKLNLHEKIFSYLEDFQANTIVFQANTNASLKNLEMQIGQLAQAL